MNKTFSPARPAAVSFEPETAKKLAEPKLRLHMLDSIRGWAAVQVLVFHVCHEMFAHRLPEIGTPWLGFILNGGFAVAIFFVLSGEVLAHGYFVRNDLGIVRKLAIKRYVRLTIPIFFSCLAVFILMKSGLIFSHQATPILNREDWLGNMLNFEPTVSNFFSYVFYGVYFSPKQAVDYNTFLWTMSAELFGSMLVFLTLFVAQTRKQRAAAYLILAPFILAFSPLLIGFIFGMIYGEMRVAGVFNRLAARPGINWLAIFIVLAVAAGVTIYPMLPIPQVAIAHRISVAAALFLFAIYISVPLQRIFDNRFSHFLGELSFPIYLVHFPIIVSLESFLVVRLFPDGAVTRLWAYPIMLSALAAALTAAFAFRYVERFAIRASNDFFAFVDRL